MKYEIKNLTLFNDLLYTTEITNEVLKTESLFICKNCVAQNETNPKIEDYITNKTYIGNGYYPLENESSNNTNVLISGTIPCGKYLFVQGNYDNENTVEISSAAEALFLESIWQKKRLEDTVYLRTLKEDNKTIFQLFRRISE